jgi:hypothetical protein
VFDVLRAHHAWSANAKHADAAAPKQTPRLGLLFLAPSGPSSRRRLASSTSPDPAAMEEDDEFGDLYTDILIPTHTPASTSALSNPVLVETLHRPPPHPNPTPVAAAAEEVDDDWLLGGSEPIPGVDPTGDWADEDDDGGEPAPPAKRSTSADDIDPLMGGGAGDSGPVIPGLSSSSAAGAAGSDEWDSDSEDDIQIVLNETDGRPGLVEDEGDDEDGEDLVIVADGPAMEEQDWGEDPAAAGAEGERKDGCEPGKTVAAPTGRIGYSGGGPGFHQQHHSMFKVSYLCQEAVRCALATPAEGDGIKLVATHYPLCCNVLVCGNFL